MLQIIEGTITKQLEIKAKANEEAAKKVKKAEK